MKERIKELKRILKGMTPSDRELLDDWQLMYPNTSFHDVWRMINNHQIILSPEVKAFVELAILRGEGGDVCDNTHLDWKALPKEFRKEHEEHTNRLHALYETHSLCFRRRYIEILGPNRGARTLEWKEFMEGTYDEWMPEDAVRLREHLLSEEELMIENWKERCRKVKRYYTNKSRKPKRALGETYGWD